MKLSILFLFAVAVQAAFLGIDYGQQSIKAMVVSPKAMMEIVLTPEAKRKDTSGICIRNVNGVLERHYGNSIGSLVTRFPQNTAMHLRSLLGKSMNDKDTIESYLRENPGANLTSTTRNTITITIDGVEYPVEQLVAMNLQEIIDRANQHIKETDTTGIDFVEQVGIAIPEQFNQAQRQALLDALALTSVKDEAVLVSDGLSVAIDYALKRPDLEINVPQYYIVFDVGTSAAKATLFSLTQPEDLSSPIKIEIGAFDSEATVGGSKFIAAIADIVEDKFLEKNTKITRKSLVENPRARAKIIQAAEKAKLVLSANNEAIISIESLVDDIDFRTTIARSEFQDIFEDNRHTVVKAIKGAIGNQLWDDNISLEDISGVILSGGSSRVPMVQEEIAKLVGEEKILKNVNADETVINGATLKGLKYFGSFKTKPLDITERSLFDYSVEMSGESSSKTVFEKGTKFPNESSILYKAPKKFGKELKFDLFESDTRILSNIVDTTVSSKNWTSACKKGQLYLNVTFDLDSNRVFKIKDITVLCDSDGNAKEEEFEFIDVINDVTKATDVMPLSNAEIRQLSNAITSWNRKDRERKRVQESLNVLEAELYDCRSFIEEFEEKLGEEEFETLKSFTAFVKEKLEYLEDNSADMSKKDIEKLVRETRSQRDTLSRFYNSLDAALGSKDFQKLVDTASKSIKKYKDIESKNLADLENKAEKFNVIGLNVTEKYNSILSKMSFSSIRRSSEENIKILAGLIDEVNESIKSKAIDDESLENLIKTKLAFEELINTLDLENRQWTYQHQLVMKELKKMYNKKMKAIKKQEKQNENEENGDDDADDEDENKTKKYLKEGTSSDDSSTIKEEDSTGSNEAGNKGDEEEEEEEEDDSSAGNVFDDEL